MSANASPAAGSSSTIGSTPGASPSRTAGSPPSSRAPRRRVTATAVLAPGFVDVHVHGWGGHDAMGDRAALDGMARALLRHGVTSFLPTGVSAPLDDLYRFADASGTGCRPPRPTGPSRSDSTSKGRSWRTRARAPTTRAPAGAGGRCDSRTSSPSRRAAADDHRAGVARGARPHRLAPRPRRGGLDGPFGGHARRGPRRLRGRRHLDDAPVQRDERGRPPRPGSRGRRAQR